MNHREAILKEIDSMPFFNHLNITDDKEYDFEHHKGEVIHELQYHIKDSTYSRLFLNQLTQLHGLGYVEIDGYKHPYELTMIYWTLENIIYNKIEYKIFNRKGSLLKGLEIYHVHHNQSFYSMNNFKRYFMKKYPNEESVVNRVYELIKKDPNCYPYYDIVYEAFMESLSWKYKTGEWILFQMKNDKYYFIALALHDDTDQNDKKLYGKIKEVL
ncbi:hypothetical protein FACS1894130_07830 [Spirochaetia bacterium]|nr:hypothetical protein FACS1894130_07830 [Spirochaetia bacterium]